MQKKESEELMIGAEQKHSRSERETERASRKSVIAHGNHMQS